MIVFVLSVFIRAIDPKIYRNYRWTISPDCRDQVNALNNPVMFPAPVPCYQFDLMRIRFVQRTIVNDKYTFFDSNQRFASLYNASVWWGCLSNNRLTESWAIDLGSSGKHRDASVHEHAWYVEMRKFTKLLLVHFGGFTLVRSPFWVCLTLELALLALSSFGRNQARKS